MFRILKSLPLLAIVLSVCCERLPGSGDGTPVEGTELAIEWEDPQQVKAGSSKVTGGYPRIHRLNDSRLMLSYSADGNAYASFSLDEGKKWSSPKKIMKYEDISNSKGSARLTAAVPDFTQLSADHPKHPGRIIYACNYRPRELKSDGTLGEKGWTTVAPYDISISFSDDNGATWSEPRHVYKSGQWTENLKKGCWEPFVLELPDGTVQVYFADETPYYIQYGASESSKKDWMNISVIESKDGGDTWRPARVVSQNSECRDGMPVVAIHEDKLLLAVETTDYKGQRLHPIVICNPIENNWASVVGKGSSFRFEPFRTSIASEVNYSGAPYIITTDNYVVYSYQIADWWKPAPGMSASEQLRQAKLNNEEQHATLEVQVCPKSEVENGYFRTMRAPSRPLPVDQTTGKENALWNSICDLGNDEILAVSQHNNRVYTVRGKIVMK